MSTGSSSWKSVVHEGREVLYMIDPIDVLRVRSGLRFDRKAPLVA